jgi:hypothetical protein
LWWARRQEGARSAAAIVSSYSRSSSRTSDTPLSQEHQRGDQCGAFVAVQERVVLHDMKEVGRGHLEQIGMQQLSKRRCTRLLDG